MKTCSKCGEEKSVDNFCANNNNKDGLHVWCKKCDNENHKHFRKENPELLILRGMIKRCYDKNEPAYKHYGKRGIKVCDRWLNSYEDFIKDVGPKPTKKHSIDRINNDGNYEKSNCRWTDRTEQSRNQRVREDNTSGCRGVNLHTYTNKWQARISVNYKRINLGFFDDLEDAIKARKEAETKYWNNE